MKTEVERAIEEFTRECPLAKKVFVHLVTGKNLYLSYERPDLNARGMSYKLGAHLHFRKPQRCQDVLLL